MLANTKTYTKISNTGVALPDTAKLGSGPNEWACTKDNKTGLIWEVKTADGGIRDRRKMYYNYNADFTACPSSCNNIKYGDTANSDGFVNLVNKQNLCGKNDWRIPSAEELKSLVVCSDGEYNVMPEDKDNGGYSGYICKNYSTVTQPSINSTYFPNTDFEVYFNYWTSSPDKTSKQNAFTVRFNNGSVERGEFRGYPHPIRLVR
jgi:hypothetical protein